MSAKSESKRKPRARDDAQDIEHARRVFDDEIAGLAGVRDRIGAEIIAAVDAIVACRGRLIVSGVGKSGLIAQKVAATLTSTGTPSFFLHAVDAAHGDLGLVSRGDVAMIVSKSGMGDELRALVPPLQRLGVAIIAVTGNRDSFLGQKSDIVLDTAVAGEAGTLGLAPTTSTTAALVMGDALASALMERKGFTPADFARFHPSGILGRRLTLTVGEVMRKGTDLPIVGERTSLRDALFEIMEKSIGCTGIVDEAGVLTGIITDGDLKRIVARTNDALDLPVVELMTRGPRTISPDMLAADALADMELNAAGPLLMFFIVDAAGRPAGLLHLHDILRAGLRAE